MTETRLEEPARGKLAVIPGWAALTLPQLWALVSLVCIFVILNLVFVRPHDFWWHVRAGAWIVENGRVPAVDLFSFTRGGEPWAYQSWLTEVVLYSLFRVGDLPLVIFFNTLIITAAYGVLLRVSQRAAGGDLRLAALATIAAACLILINRNPRPQSISFLLFALTLYLIERHASRLPSGRSRLGGDGLLYWLVPLFLLWANTHGGFVFGLALLGTYTLAELLAWLRRQGPFPTHLLLVTLLCLAATLLTPLGLGMVDYVLGFLRHPITRSLNMEFWPPTIRTLDGLLFFAYVGGWTTLLLLSGYRPSPREWIRLVLFGGLALMARRNAVWFGFVAAPVMAASLRNLRSSPERNIRLTDRGPSPARRRINLIIAVLVVLLAGVSLPWFRPYLPPLESRQTYVSHETPVDAVAFLRDLSLPGHVFHSEAYGSYMIWASPEVPVFIDTRIELYLETQWRDYFALNGARYDWETILDRYGIDALLLERGKQQPLIDAVLENPNWERRYQDETAEIWARRGEP